MNRRASLAAFFGQSQNKETHQQLAPPPVLVTSGIDPYTGPWEYEHAAHLLRRAMFGPNNTQIKQAVSEGLTATISKLFEA